MCAAVGVLAVLLLAPTRMAAGSVVLAIGLEFSKLRQQLVPARMSVPSTQLCKSPPHDGNDRVVQALGLFTSRSETVRAASFSPT
jgi:hypothetical protein